MREDYSKETEMIEINEMMREEEIIKNILKAKKDLEIARIKMFFSELFPPFTLRRVRPQMLDNCLFPVLSIRLSTFCRNAQICFCGMKKNNRLQLVYILPIYPAPRTMVYYP